MFPVRNLLNLICGAGAAVVFAGCGGGGEDPVDEAMAAGKTVADYPTASADVFAGMDGGVELSADEIKGRNSWMMWTGGNEALWDHLAREVLGLTDLLKVIDSRRRPVRFGETGLINEPGFVQSTDPDEFGLYIDQPASEPVAGVDPEVYGLSTGVVGLRLFPNPNFDEKARKHWDAKRYYEDSSYYQDTELVRPYRVGMACSFCHVAFHPLHPPENPEIPEWRNLSALIGNQYFRNREVFGPDLKDDDFLFYVLGTARPGTVDTSIVATDHNNNPNIINAIFDVEARLSVATTEKVSGEALLFPGGPERPVPHILVDGADGIGAIPALARVYVNIGAFSEEWMRCHNPVVGFRTQKPFSVELARKNSVYWQVTEKRSENIAKYLIAASKPPMKLREAPGGEAYLTDDQAVLDRGKIVFAENCVACHSSKRPEDGVERQPEEFEAWSKSPEFLAWAREAVMKPDFLENNYLSTDARYPVTLLKTNAARALQNNAIPGAVWQNFSSDTYKETPSTGKIEVYNPFDESTYEWEMPAGGPGFYRVPSLVGIWARAPYLHNNALGEFTGDPSVAGRMKAFENAITKMFWEDRRPGEASITRLKKRSHVKIPAAYVPAVIEGVAGPKVGVFLRMPWLLPGVVVLSGLLLGWLALRRRKRVWKAATGLIALVALAVGVILFPLNYTLAGKRGDLKLGPFPAGMPVNALINLDPETPPSELLPVVRKLSGVLKRIDKEGLSDEEGLALINAEVGTDLMRLSKSPDWVDDRGHYFASHLSDEDKRALIEYLKTL